MQLDENSCDAFDYLFDIVISPGAWYDARASVFLTHCVFAKFASDIPARRELQ